MWSYYFEYSSTYKKRLFTDLDNSIPFSSLSLYGPQVNESTDIFDPDSGEIKTVTGQRVNKGITVRITDFKPKYGESYKATDEIKVVLDSNWENFQLLNRRPLSISGLEGEEIEYLIDRLMPIPVENGKNLDYCVEVYFNYNGLIWEITARGDQEIREELKADFDHILKTFKIIE